MERSCGVLCGRRTPRDRIVGFDHRVDVAPELSGRPSRGSCSVHGIPWALQPAGPVHPHLRHPLLNGRGDR